MAGHFIVTVIAFTNNANNDAASIFDLNVFVISIFANLHIFVIDINDVAMYNHVNNEKFACIRIISLMKVSFHSFDCWLLLQQRVSLKTNQFDFLLHLISTWCFIDRITSSTIIMEKHIEHEPFYHGLLPREDMKTMLKKNGDFLLRTSEPNAGERAVILSMMVHEDREEHGVSFHLLFLTLKYIIA